MHKQFLLAALEQARIGLGVCAPNPCVGAVAVQNGKIIAQTSHRGAGTPHAEQLLLAQIPPKTPGVSLYISLEPCNHWGRTPPCVEAIINHGGIEHVIFAYADPNPIVAQNNSTAQLRAHGIKVTHYSVDEISKFYESYTHWTLTREPRVTVKMAHTLNGKIGRADERVMLSNSLCETFTHQMRAATDVILTSARTIRVDNPRLNVRLGTKEQAKPVAIIDRQLTLDKGATIFSTAAHCHIYHCEARDVVYTNSSLHWVPMLDGGMDLSAVIKHLGELGYHDVWVEAGGAIFSALHHAGLVHRTYLYLVPASLEQNAISAYQQNGIFNRPHTVSWQVMNDNIVACIDWQKS